MVGVPLPLLPILEVGEVVGELGVGGGARGSKLTYDVVGVDKKEKYTEEQ